MLQRAIGIAVIGLMLALSGCSPVGEAAPTPTVTVAVPGDANGDGKLSGFEKEQLAKSTYTLPDGTEIPIPKDEPLPKSVVAAIKARIDPLAQRIGEGTSFTLVELEGPYMDAVRDESTKVGRTILAVMYGFGYEGRAWVVSEPVADQFGSKSEAIAAAKAYIGDNTSNFTYIVFD
jgi:hypothetical protein